MANVLIVDDAKFMRMTLAKMLENGGHTVVGEAENGQRAIELYREVRPDVVTMDITMPEMTGIEAVKRSCANSRTQKLLFAPRLASKNWSSKQLNPAQRILSSSLLMKRVF